ncbi:MAG TPA: tyrosine-type recombinase/integrase [Saprospiraceae bacterium]|nr:tyrosine-type recombinase/integrase [Saprospiraceae bacterium]
MSTFKAVLWKYRPNKQGEYPVKIRINSRDHQSYVNLKINVTKQQWDHTEGRVRKSNPNHKEHNLKIMKTLASLSSQDTDRSAKSLKESLTGRSDCLYNYANSLIETYTEANTVTSYKMTLELICKVFGSDVKLRDIDYPFVQKFVQYLRKTLSDQSVKVRVSFLQTVFNAAKDEGLIHPTDNPFRNLSFKKSTSSKVTLSLAELNKLRLAELTGHQAEARDAFLLSFNIRGLRASDVVRLSHANLFKSRIILISKKDKENISCRLTSEAMQIISRNKQDGYFFSFLKRDINSAVDTYRKALIKACATAGITKHVTPHVARHTWVQLAIHAGIDMKRIQDSLGHSDIKTTQGYAHGFDTVEMDNINNLVTQLNPSPSPPSSPT